ncbi:MAG: hypothetical protein FWE05_06500 [Defluviitaleaceae bacterium]|nr:hypothetical protein [Defluviitaleaceae bacterium]
MDKETEKSLLIKEFMKALIATSSDEDKKMILDLADASLLNQSENIRILEGMFFILQSFPYSKPQSILIMRGND